MSSNLLQICLFSLALSGAFSVTLFKKDTFKSGKCPDFEPMANFNLSDYLGSWYEIQRYPNQYEFFTSCVVTDYEITSVDSQGSHVLINMTYVRFGKEEQGSLDGLYLKNDNKAEFVIMPEYSTKPNSFILKTDYSSYSLNYDCKEYPLGIIIESAWINARTRTLPEQTIDELKDYLQQMGSDISKFEEPEHVNCPGTDTYNKDDLFKYVNFSS